MSADTMSEAIALSSPSGRMSKRARKAAEKRLGAMICAEIAQIRASTPHDPRPGRIARLESRVRLMRDFVARGYRPRVHARELAAAEAELATLKS